ncbi:hypothetical protein AB1Y20_014899 [Prymnesium parvum]|uniref:Uncharacterized protein n=1 Tax=Prymnesium parvum TaxID=97485 RepID=A0AB34JZT5_PRYPA
MAKRAHGTDAWGRPAGARTAELARRPPPTSHVSADDELRSILTPLALAAPEPALRFARWAKDYPCVLRAHQLVLSREASILRRHEELSARRPNSSVKMTSAQLLGRALVEAYCGSFDGPLLPGLDFFDKSICVAPTFCSWVLPPVPPHGVRLVPPPLSYILSCHLVATSPTYNPLSSKAHPHAAVDVFLQASAARQGIAAGTMQDGNSPSLLLPPSLHPLHPAPMRLAGTSHPRLAARDTAHLHLSRRHTAQA